MMIVGINHLHDASYRARSLSVMDMVIDSVLQHIRDMYKDLSVAEKHILVDFFKSEKPVTIITTRFSAKEQSQLIDELLREESFTCSKIPNYLCVTLTGISASQKFYSSFWTSPNPTVCSAKCTPVPMSRPKPVKVSVYLSQDRFDHRQRRPGGVHVGPRKPVPEFKVYNDVAHGGFFHTIQNYMRSILPNFF